MLILSFNSALAYNYPDSVKNFVEVNQKIHYNPATKTWSRTPINSGITFVKHMTVGSGGFSEFLYKKKYYDTSTTLEFFNGNKLIGYSQHLLKFFELGWSGKGITKKELTANEVKQLFPNTQIVLVSKFKKNKITLVKPRKSIKTFLILNDTNRDFYKYSYEKYGNGTELIKSIIEPQKPQKIVFSHFGSRDAEFPILIIKIRNSFLKK